MIKKYFLADDDQDDIELFHEALRDIHDSIEFRSVQDGKEAITTLRQSDETPEIIFLDINMPGMNGWECLAELKKSEDLREIPVLMYSTSSAGIEGHKAIRSGAIGFLEKPPSFLKLKAFLEIIFSASDQNLIPTLRQIAATRQVKLVVA